MRVTVCFGDPCWRLIGKREIEVALYRGATVADLLAVLAKRYPTHTPVFENPGALSPIFIDDTEAVLDSRLTDGARLRFNWPTSGG